MKLELGARLRAERERVGLTQDEAAAGCGVAKSTYTYYEAGARSPDAEFLVKAHKLGIDIAKVMGVEAGEMAATAQLSAGAIEEALKAVREAEIERLSFLQPVPLWVAVQRTATFGPSSVGGFKEQARSAVEDQLRQPPATAKKRASKAKNKKGG